MKDREGKIIYIGQSSDLKARLGSFRHVLGSLVRCLHRLTFPDLPVSSYPLGLWSGRPPLQYRLAFPHTSETAHLLTTYATRNPEPLLTQLTALNLGTTEAEQELWTEELDRLTKFAAKMHWAAPTN